MRLQILYAILLCVAFSCRKYNRYSETPHIEFVSLGYSSSVKDENKMKIAKLKFNVYDGDGDVGVPFEDTVVNFFTEIMVRRNGVFISADSAKVYNYTYKMPFIEPDERDINFEAEATVNIEYTALSMPYDTIKYRFYLLDYAGNKSNVEETSIAVLDK